MKVPQAMVLTTAVSVTGSNGGAVDDHHVEEGLQLTQGLGHRGRAEQLAGVGRSRTRADKGDVRRVRHLNFYESRVTSADLVGVGRCRLSAHSVVVLPSRAVVAPNRLVRSVTVTGGAQDFALYDRCHVRMRRP